LAYIFLVRIPRQASEEGLEKEKEATGREDSASAWVRAEVPSRLPANESEVPKNEDEEGEEESEDDDAQKSEAAGGEEEPSDNNSSSDEAEMDPRRLLEKWKIQSLAKLREETKRGIDLMKKEITEAKEKEIRELRKDAEILRAELVAEKKRKDRGKQREKIEREVTLQTELAKRKDEVVALQERLAKVNRVRTHQCPNQLVYAKMRNGF
jgi:hypothetical protein